MNICQLNRYLYISFNLYIEILVILQKLKYSVSNMFLDEQKENVSKKVDERKFEDEEKRVYTKRNAKEKIGLAVGTLEGKIESEKEELVQSMPKMTFNFLLI